MKTVHATWWETQENSDLTEGRGQNVTVTIWDNEEAAVADAQHRGVQGVGGGQVIECEIYVDDVLHADAKPGQVFLSRTKVWGYRPDWNGNWGYGWIDHRDAPVNHPEYATYVRLRKIFEGIA